MNMTLVLVMCLLLVITTYKQQRQTYDNQSDHGRQPTTHSVAQITEHVCTNQILDRQLLLLLIKIELLAN